MPGRFFFFSRDRFARPRRRLQGESLETRCVPAAIVMSAHEQLLIELINRARLDPPGEAARIGSSEGLNSGMCDGVQVNISATPKQPLAPHQALADAAELHSQDMLDRDYFSHTTLGTNNGPTQRAQAQGYPGSAGENISTFRQSPTEFTVQDMINQVYDRHKSLWESECHRINMLRDNWEDVGTGIRFGDYLNNGIDWNASMVTENFGSAVGGKLTGVAYSESAVVAIENPNLGIYDAGIYNIGEGVGGLTITARDAAGNTFTTTTGPSGGYELAAPAGTYTLTATGGSLGNGVVTKSGVRHLLDGFQNSKVDFLTDTAVNVGPLTVNATSGNDTIIVRPKPNDPNSVEVLVNGQAQSHANSSVTGIFVNGLGGADEFTFARGVPHNVTFDGGAGIDKAQFDFSGGAHTVTMRPALTQVTGDGPDATARNFEEVRVLGDTSDVARLYDSAGNDEFQGHPTFAYLTGPNFFNHVSRIDNVIAFSDAGGSDKAFLFDSAGNDTFNGRPASSELYGPGFFNRATRFDQVFADSTAGGTDKAFLYDSADDDTFTGRPTVSDLAGAGFLNRATSFNNVTAYATAGGLDKAHLYDSAGNDTFRGRHTHSDFVGAGFFNRAISFDQVFGYAEEGGLDKAYLYDSPGDDTFSGRPASSELTGAGFFNRASSFDQVFAEAAEGGLDKAYLYDSAANDTFYGRPVSSDMSGPGFFNRAKKFDQVFAESSAGGFDKAYLYDSAGDDFFNGRPLSSELYGATFFNRASGFDQVLAYATAGGFDKAFLYDSAGDDRFNGASNYGFLRGLGFYNYVNSFDEVRAIATAGGTDEFNRDDPLTYTLLQLGLWEL